jgi:hypothetical protein
MKPELIQSAFKNAGLNPLNPNIFTEEGFALSNVYSTQANVPASYPTDVPSLDPIKLFSDSDYCPDDDDIEMGVDDE